MITVAKIVNETIEKVWNAFIELSYITQWYNASADWYVSFAEKDLQIGGKFKTTTAANDESFSFDFEGIYTLISNHQLIKYVLADNRKVKTTFVTDNNAVKVTQQFDPENENPYDVQQQGWHVILNNFKNHSENPLNNGTRFLV